MANILTKHKKLFVYGGIVIEAMTQRLKHDVQLGAMSKLGKKRLESRDLKEQCVAFRAVYWQKWNIILISMFSLVFNHLKLRIIVFSLP